MSLALRIGTGAVAVALFSSASAFAQVPPPAVAPVPGVPATDPAAMPAPVPVAEPTPVAAPAPVAQEASDLDQFVGHIGIGYMGTNLVPLGFDEAGAEPQDYSVPAIGFRYWMSSKMGIEAGLGLAFGSSSTESDGVSADGPSQFGFVLHGGLPLALANYRHVSFQVVPYLQLAYGSRSYDLTDETQSGLRLSLGAKAGSEVFFGFIGLPQISLSATVGAEFTYTKYSVEVDDVTTSVSFTSFGTTVQNNPWDIFTGSIAARYYF